MLEHKLKMKLLVADDDLLCPLSSLLQVSTDALVADFALFVIPNAESVITVLGGEEAEVVHGLGGSRVGWDCRTSYQCLPYCFPFLYPASRPPADLFVAPRVHHRPRGLFSDRLALPYGSRDAHLPPHAVYRNLVFPCGGGQQVRARLLRRSRKEGNAQWSCIFHVVACIFC